MLLTGKYLCSALSLAAASTCSAMAQIPEQKPAYSRLNSIGVFGEYSNDSSPILLGSAVNRKLAAFGFSYTRRLLQTRRADLHYLLELRPVLLASDPELLISQVSSRPDLFQTASYTVRQSYACRPGMRTGNVTLEPDTFAVMTTISCGRRWTFGQAFSPAGLELNARPGTRVQPVLSASGGYVLSSRPIPIDNAGSFNYTFSFGAGVEYFLSGDRTTSFFGNRSIRLQYRYHHISNAGTADENPGVDSGLFQVAYSFGR